MIHVLNAIRCVVRLIGHSEGTIIAPRVAVDNPTKVKNIVLIGAQAQNLRDALYFQWVYLPLLYAEKVLDHNHNGSISIQEASKYVSAIDRGNKTVKLQRRLLKDIRKGWIGFLSVYLLIPVYSV